MNQTETGKFISAKRKEKGITQRELAERLGVTDKAVSKWETGRGLPDVSILEALAEELGVTVSEILSGSHVESDLLPQTADKIIVDTMKESRKKVSRKRLLAIGAGAAAAILFICLSVAVHLYSSSVPYNDTEKLEQILSSRSDSDESGEKVEILKQKKDGKYMGVLYKRGDEYRIVPFAESIIFPGRYNGISYMTSPMDTEYLKVISCETGGNGSLMLVGAEKLPDEACYFSFNSLGNDEIYEIKEREPFLEVILYQRDHQFPYVVLLNKDKEPLYDEFGQRIEENWK